MRAADILKAFFNPKGPTAMSTLEFGLTLLVTGMGGTLATLWVLTLIISALTRHLPAEETKPVKPGGTP